jgi:hypothetical protein
MVVEAVLYFTMETKCVSKLISNRSFPILEAQLATVLNHDY